MSTKLDWKAVDREQRNLRLADYTAPIVLPPAWEEIERHPDGAKYVCASRLLAAIVSCCYEADGRAWIHLSVSHRDRVPTWQELVHCKGVFLGDREAYQVLPPRKRYVNIHPNCLHMFALLEEKATALPDFTRGTGSL